MYAIRCREGDQIQIRLGGAGGIYFLAHPGKTGGLIFEWVEYQSGDVNMQSPFPKNRWITFGRIQECDFQLKHAVVSRTHFQLRYDENILLLKDLDSTNGTFLSFDIPSFDIEGYMSKRKSEKPGEGTLDWIHQEFGPALDDFLKRYQEGKLK